MKVRVQFLSADYEVFYRHMSFRAFEGHGRRHHKISRGDNYNKFYLLTLFDRISITFSHRVWGLELGSWGARARAGLRV